MKKQILLMATVLVTGIATTYGQVGIGTETPNASSILELDVDSYAENEKKGFLPPRMTMTQRDDIVSPVAGLMIYNTTSGCLEFFDGDAWQCTTDNSKDGSSAKKAAMSCKAIKDTKPSSPDGTYWLDIDGGLTAFAPMQAYCDMTTDGGGWTLIGQHNHPNGVNAPSLRNNFPNRGSDNPNVNEKSSTGVFGFYGLINQSMRQMMIFSEYRVESYLATSGFHFKSTDVNFITNNTAEIGTGKTNLSKPAYWPATTTFYANCNSAFGGVPLQEATRITLHHSAPNCHGSGATYLISRISSDNPIYTNEGLQPPGHVSVNGLNRLYVR